MVLSVERSKEKEEIRNAARIRWESDPNVTHQMVADEFGMALQTVRDWSSNHKWQKTHRVLTDLEPKRHIALVRRELAESEQETLTPEQVQVLSYREHMKQRQGVIRQQLDDVNIFRSLLLKAVIDNNADRIKNAQRAIDAYTKLAALQSRRWHLDDSVTPIFVPDEGETPSEKAS
ncbi:hypothetical protein ID007_004302 [Salmonella enterica]|nr:hypothetical protein [Salmonella enterica]